MNFVRGNFSIKFFFSNGIEGQFRSKIQVIIFLHFSAIRLKFRNRSPFHHFKYIMAERGRQIRYQNSYQVKHIHSIHLLIAMLSLSLSSQCYLVYFLSWNTCLKLNLALLCVYVAREKCLSTRDTEYVMGLRMWTASVQYV